MFSGISASDGIAIGHVVVIKEIEIKVSKVTVFNSAEEVHPSFAEESPGA